MIQHPNPIDGSNLFSDFDPMSFFDHLGFKVTLSTNKYNMSTLPGVPMLINASKSFDSLVNRHLAQSPMVTTFVALVVAAYIAFFLEQTPAYMAKYLSSPITKVAVVALALCLLNNNPVLSIAIALGFFAVLSVAKEKKLFENFQTLGEFKPSTKPTFSQVLRQKTQESNDRIAHGESTKGVMANLYPPMSEYTLANAIRDAGEKPWQQSYMADGMQLQALPDGNSVF